MAWAGGAQTQNLRLHFRDSPLFRAAAPTHMKLPRAAGVFRAASVSERVGYNHPLPHGRGSDRRYFRDSHPCTCGAPMRMKMVDIAIGIGVAIVVDHFIGVSTSIPIPIPTPTFWVSALFSGQKYLANCQLVRQGRGLGGMAARTHFTEGKPGDCLNRPCPPYMLNQLSRMP